MVSGDSGGPIFSIDSSGERTQKGVVSWGPSFCAASGESGVYSRISSSQDFIVYTVCDQFGSDASFCPYGGGALDDPTNPPTDSTTSGDDDSGTTFCSSTETYFLFEIKVDAYGGEVSWDLVDDTGYYVLFSDSGFGDGEARAYEGCLSQIDSACYYLNIYDSFGDGMKEPYNGESAYISLFFGEASYFVTNPVYTSQLTLELCL